MGSESNFGFSNSNPAARTGRINVGVQVAPGDPDIYSWDTPNTGQVVFASGGSYVVGTKDRGKLIVVINSLSSFLLTLPDPSTLLDANGLDSFTVAVANVSASGASGCIIKPSTKPIDGLSQLQLDAGQGVEIFMKNPDGFFTVNGIGTASGGGTGSGVPTGGTAQQSLTKLSSANGDVAWIDKNFAYVSVAVPPSNSVGQEGDMAIVVAPTAPSGVTTGAIALITTVVLASATGNVTFFNIPATYTDLILVMDVRGDTAATSTGILLTLNGDSGANYDWEHGQATAGVAQGAGNTGRTSMFDQSSQILFAPANTATANYSAGYDIVFRNYRSSFFKQAVMSGGGLSSAVTTSMFAKYASAWWRNTAVINSITLIPFAGNFVAGCRFSLYGRL